MSDSFWEDVREGKSAQPRTDPAVTDEMVAKAVSVYAHESRFGGYIPADMLARVLRAVAPLIAARARAAEREEIAAAFEGPVCGDNSRRIAAAIRARGETT